MNLDVKTLTEHTHYAENLSAAVEELAVTQAELAKAIGKDQKTVGRYINGETYPEGCIAEIEEYLLSRLVYEDVFVHIPSEKFEEIFSEIYDFFQDNGIREAEFAKMLGLSQKTLNNYHNRRFKKGEPLRLSTEMQHKIIDTFKKLGGGFFPSDPEDDTPSEAELRYRFQNIRRELAYNSQEYADSVSEMWRLLIQSYKNGGANFFVYAPEKLKLVCVYLRYMLSELGRIWDSTFTQFLDTGKLPNYFFREDIASLDFIWESHDDLESEHFGWWVEDDDQTPNYWCTLFYMEIWRYWKTYAAFSPQEKDETNALLRLVFDEKNRRYNENREHLKTLNITPNNIFYGNFEPPKEKISAEEQRQLAEMFAELPNEHQQVLLNSYCVFFYGINCDDSDKVITAHRRLAEMSFGNKHKFVAAYENEIIGDLLKTGTKFFDDYINKFGSAFSTLWDYISDYFALMSFSINRETFRFEQPSAEYFKKFQKKIRSLHKDSDPVATMKAQLDYHQLDWYANMLADIALLKGFNLAEMLREIEDE